VKNLQKTTKLNIFFCKKCIEFVSEIGREQLILYTDICSYYVRNGPYRLEPRFEKYLNEIVCDLERGGYLISTDVGKKIILLKPLGHSIKNKYGKDEHYFCVDGFHLE
jgi:hypothetical protein